MYYWYGQKNCNSSLQQTLAIQTSIFSDHSSSYSELLHVSGPLSTEATIACCSLRNFKKTLNNLNSNLIKEIFYLSPNLFHRKDDLYVHSPKK